MTGELDDAVELLDRSLAYTRVALADVTEDRLTAPTPCVRWSLAGLLTHMDDALDAFLEAAAGAVRVDPPATTAAGVPALQAKACALLGAWARGTPADVAVGDRGLPGRLLVGTAALEVAVHGWDVGQATGGAAPLPEDLARRLLGVAERVVTPWDRGVRFASPQPTDPTAAYDARLLAFLGRDPAGAVPVRARQVR